MNEKIQQFLELGYCAYEGILDDAQQQHIRDAMDAHWVAKGGGLDRNFGFGIHPLFPVLPELAPYLAHPVIEETLRELFDDEVHLCHAGARMSSEAMEPRIGWHDHYAWDYEEVPGRARPTRALAGVYVDGTAPERGAFVTLPRKVDEAIGPPRGGSVEAWPGERDVHMAPGSIAIFDTALWHAAKAGTQPGMRRLFGAHYQGWSNPRSHPEDNACDVPEIEPYFSQAPLLEGMVRRA